LRYFSELGKLLNWRNQAKNQIQYLNKLKSFIFSDKYEKYRKNSLNLKISI